MMKTLFAPWRYKYVTKSDKRSQGLFKNIIASSDDEANFILVRGTHCAVLLNKYPYSPGHLMILPMREVAEFELLDSEETAEMMRFCQQAVKALKQIYSPDGFNIGMNIGSEAGAGIAEHLHMHIVPRWRADTNFITSIAGTRVVPEDLSQTYEKLKGAFRKISEK